MAGNVHDFNVTNNFVHDVNNIGIDFIGGEGFSPDPATDVVRNGEVSGNRVTRVHFTGTGRDGAGIFVDGSQNIIVECNTTWNNDIGIEVNAVRPVALCTNVIVRDNYVFANRESGIAAGASQLSDGTEQDCQVTNNTLFHNETQHNGDGELRLQIGTGNVVENNIVVAFHAVPLIDGTFGSGNNTSDYNLLFQSRHGDKLRLRVEQLLLHGAEFVPVRRQAGPAPRSSPDPLLLSPGKLQPALVGTSRRRSTLATRASRRTRVKRITLDTPGCRGRQ